MPADMLVGRRLAIGALRSAVDAALAGAGGVVLLEGEAGMGKTALASDAAVYAKAQGAVAVWAACWEGDGAPGYWPWIQVVRGLERAGGGTGETVLAELTGATEARGGILGNEAAARFRTYDEAATYVRWCAAQRPLVIVLDDLHWADLSSLRLLVFLARQLHDAAALVIGTYRDVDMATGDHLARPLLAELAGQAELLQLTGLTAGEVGRLLDMVCGERPPPALVRAVHDRTGGNPFFAQQIARLLVSRGVRLDGGPVTGVPPAVRDVLVRRLARLPREVVDLLAVAAVAGPRFSIATVAAVAGEPIEVAMPHVDNAVHAAVLEHDQPGRARFSHDLFRDVLYDGLPGARRSALHLALAELLEQQGDPATSAAEIAQHRRVALPLGDRDRAIAALAEAGREATARTAFDEAAAHLRHAVDVAGGTTAIGLATLCEYGDALRRAGRGDDAQAAFFAAAARARAVGDTALLARAAFGAHRVTTLTQSSRSGVIALLEEALAKLDGAAQGDVGALETRSHAIRADPHQNRGGPDGYRRAAGQQAVGKVFGEPGVAITGPLYLGAVPFDGGPGELLPGYQRLLEQFPIYALDVHLCIARENGLTIFDACPAKAVHEQFTKSDTFLGAVGGAGLRAPRIEGLGDVLVAYLRDEVRP